MNKMSTVIFTGADLLWFGIMTDSQYHDCQHTVNKHLPQENKDSWMELKRLIPTGPVSCSQGPRCPQCRDQWPGLTLTMCQCWENVGQTHTKQSLRAAVSRNIEETGTTSAGNTIVKYRMSQKFHVAGVTVNCAIPHLSPTKSTSLYSYPVL